MALAKVISVSTPTPLRSASIHFSTMPKLDSSQAINLARKLTFGRYRLLQLPRTVEPSNSTWMWARRSDWRKSLRTVQTNACYFPEVTSFGVAPWEQRWSRFVRQTAKVDP